MSIYFSKDGVRHLHDRNSSIVGAYVDKTNVKEDDCDCDIFAYVKVVDKEFVSRRLVKGKRLTFQQMTINLLCRLDAALTVKNSSVVVRDSNNSNLNYPLIKALTGPNMYNIKPPFPATRLLPSGPLTINKDIADDHQAWDVLYLSSLCNRNFPRKFLLDEVFEPLRQSGSVIADKNGFTGSEWRYKVMSLTSLCLRKVSCYNNVYGTYNGVPNLSYSMDGAENKIYAALANLSKPTHTMQHLSNSLSSNLSTVLQFMTKMLKVEEFKRSRVWIYSLVKSLNQTMPIGGASGLRAGPNVKINVEDTYANVTVNGKKAHQIEYAVSQLDEMYAAHKRGEPVVFKDRAWVDIGKAETLAGLTGAEILKFNEKLRLICINSIALALGERYVHSFRQNIERGNHIAIGTNFWSGGANKMANRLHCGKKGYKWFTGDFSSLDTTLKAPMLLIYSHFSSYYYKEDRGDYDFMEKLLEEVAKNLVYRPTLVYRDIWKMIYGGMPSGAYETSHGDSWIVMFIFVSWMVSCAQRHPPKMADIYMAMLTGEIYFVIYGDDFVFAMPDRFCSILNVESLSKYCSTQFDMVMRDCCTFDSFLSVPCSKSGRIVKPNVVFLSRYFVSRDSVTTRKDLPEVLPYRDMLKIVKKLPYDDKGQRTDFEMVLASIGAAYDTNGTNLRAYQYCKFMYDRAMSRFNGLTFAEVRENVIFNANSKNLNNIFKKTLVTYEELLKGFPSLDSLLERHVDDPSKHIYRDEGYAGDSMSVSVFDELYSDK